MAYDECMAAYYQNVADQYQYGMAAYYLQFAMSIVALLATVSFGVFCCRMSAKTNRTCSLLMAILAMLVFLLTVYPIEVAS